MNLNILKCRNLGTKKGAVNTNGLKCGVDYFLEAQENGEINEDNVLYIVENLNVAGINTCLLTEFYSFVFRFHFSRHVSIYTIISSRNVSRKMKRKSVILNCVNLFDNYSKSTNNQNFGNAAIETTVWALEWAIAELINNPEIQEKLRAEIDTALGPGQQVRESDTNKLPYLQAVIKETLRRRMVVPCLLPHMNLHQEKLGGFDIPAESRVLVNAWYMANDPARWAKPEEFRPERFLNEESKVETTGNDLKYIPFGVGRRSCPGIVIAMPVLGITLGRLVQNFELLPPPGQSKVDTAENNGQFATRILKHYTVVMKPIRN